MKLVAGLIVLGVMTAFCGGCEHSRTPGLFQNKFQNSTDGNFIPDDTLTDTDAYDDEEIVTFDHTINIFSQATTTLTITDYGVIFPATPTPYKTYPGDPFSDDSHPYIAALWFKDDSGSGNACTYEKTIKHLKLSEMRDANGLAVGPSRCDLQRIENIVNKCDDSYPTYSDLGTVEINEAVIVTWEITCSAGADVYHFQTVVATGLDKNNTDQPETFVIFLYDGIIPAGFDGTKIERPFINGKYNGDVNREYAAPCVESNDNNELPDYTNCRCNSWLTGIYVFATRDNNPGNDWDENTCTLDAAAFSTKCVSSDEDTRKTFKMNCRPSRKPQDTCTEDLFCATDRSTVSPVTYAFMVKDVGNWTEFEFLDADSLAELTDSSCRGDFVVQNGIGIYRGSISNSVTPGCGWKVSGSIYKFAIRTYNPLDADAVYGRALTLVGTCVPGDLPYSIDVGITASGVITQTVEPIRGEKLKAMFLKERRWEDNNPYTAYPDGSEVQLNEDLFFAIGYDYGTSTVVRTDGVDPYGIYVEDCWISNNAEFVDFGDDKVVKIVDDGCNTKAAEPFYIQDEFMEKFYEDDDGTGLFNFVVISGKMNAVQFRTGGHYLFYKCYVNFCRNYNFFDDSRCKKSCTNKDVDFDTTVRRRKRSDDGNNLLAPMESVEVLASIRIVPRKEEDSSGQIECVTSTVAISTLVALLVLLIMAVLVTLMLFIKLQRRQKK